MSAHVLRMGYIKLNIWVTLLLNHHAQYLNLLNFIQQVTSTEFLSQLKDFFCQKSYHMGRIVLAKCFPLCFPTVLKNNIINM